MTNHNCDICEMWNIGTVATQTGTYADGKVLHVCNTCYKGGALSATVEIKEITPMHIGPRVGYVDYVNEYDDYIITWRRSINDREYVFTYVETPEGETIMNASRKRVGIVHHLFFS